MSIDLFDASYYQAANPDLAKAGITTEAQLRAHFERVGLNEGREFSPFVNLNVYRASNGDLQAAGLTTNQQLLAHLQNKGVAEGRSFSQFGDIKFYLQSNNDVNQFFQGNREQAFLHLKNNGVKEGRLFSPVVDLNFYRDVNSDLKSLDNNQALQHLAMFGVAEGREFSYPLNLNYYDLNNPDLLTYYASTRNLSTEAVLDNPAELSSYNKFLLSHFATFGIREGRRSSDEFDVNYYRSANKDLAGLSNEQLYDHFRNFGINELRPLSDSYDAEYYSQVSSAPNSSNLTPAQLFNYYITTGIEQGDNAVPFFKPPNEVLPEFDLIGGNGTVSGILNAGDGANLERKGSYSEEYLLNGLDPGQQVQLDLTADYDAYLQLVDLITGEVIAENDNIGSGNSNSRINFTVEPGIEYLVRVSGDNANAVGAFTLSGQASSTIVGTLAANGGNVSESITNTDLPDPDEPNAFKRDYRLDLTGVNPGQELKISLNSASFDTYVEMIDADTKEFIHFNDDINDETTDSQLRFVVESGINYAVRVTSYDEQVTGNFTLTSMVEAGTNPQIARDETVAGTFTPDGDPNKTDIYTLQGVNPGEQIRVNVESETLDTFVQLLANGVPISSNDDANGETDSELTLTVQPNTTYQIQVNRSQQDSAGEGHYTITTTPLTGEGSTVTLSDPGMQSLLANKTSLGREDVLAFINQATADGTVSVEEQADLKELASEAVALRMPDSVQFQLAQVNDAIDKTGQNTAFAANQAQIAITQNFFPEDPKPVFYDEGKKQEFSVKHLKIEGQLYDADAQPRIYGINQGGLIGVGDCAFLAGLGATFSTTRPQGQLDTIDSVIQEIQSRTSSVIQQMIKQENDGSYTFRFYEAPNKSSYYTVSQTVATRDDGYIAFAGRGGKLTSPDYRSDVKFFTPNKVDTSIWVPLAEKAYAVLREKTADTNFRNTNAGRDDGYSLIGNGDNVKDPLERITGRTGNMYQEVTIENKQGDQTIDTRTVPLYSIELKKELTFDDLTNALNKGKAIEAGTGGGLGGQMLVGGSSDPNGGGHAYSVMATFVTGGTQHVVVRNPHGYDNARQASGDPYDGFIDLTFSDFLKGFGSVAIV